jgi:alanyl-tRNA synthetase
MNSLSVRKTFLDFFSEKNHKLVPSSSIVPNNDKSLMFTNAGMIQFKDVFLGAEKINYLRATSAQKCIRAGGKHNDLENVGYTLRHHTFFEMLGNFSFGDYFKEDAIAFAWELLTKHYNLPEEKLWVTVHESDAESEKIWINKIGIDKTRLSKLSEDNFWSMGETGPCGPCSEIFYDHGEHLEGNSPEEGKETGERFVEIYNLVFMQFNRDLEGNLNSLPKPSVDTGMGFERICAVLQNTPDNYETDLFKPLINEIANACSEKDLSNSSLRVIADHLRASCFMISDGVSIGNEGRNYVLRRIVRRALRHGYKLNDKHVNTLSSLVPFVVNLYKELYPELKKNESLIRDALVEEELKFNVTLNQGMNLLETEIKNSKNKSISGELAFKLYDTYGFPLDMTLDFAREMNLEVDVKGYDELMNQQKTRAKESSSFESLLPSSIDLVEDTKFIGYEDDSAKAEIKIIFQDGIQTKLATEGECAIIFNETPFYAESGGQVGDSGKVYAANGSGEIFDTKKMGSQHIHLCRILDGSFSENDLVEIEIEKERRDKIVLNHSATHLMHAALRNVLGTHVQQKGSLVNEEKLRFDFSHSKAVSSDEIKLIEDQVNEIIKKDIATEIFETSFDEAIKMGALAFFGDKYGEKVRVLKIGGDYSTELCGGTHVEKTGQIENFKIVSESSISSGVRRIEAVTGNEANLLLKEESNEIKKIADSFGVSVSELDRKVKESKKVIDLFQKKFKDFENINNMNLEKHFESNFEKINEMNVLMQRIDGLNLSSLRGNLDNLKNKTPKAIIILVGENNSKAQIVVSVTKDLFGTYSAKDILNSLSTKFNFKGGGKDDYAQAGGDSIEVLDRVFEEVRLLISS